MARRPGRPMGDHDSPLVDVADVFADDELIDSISLAPPGGRREFRLGTSVLHGTPRSSGAAVLNSDPLIDLFGDWRDELSAVPMPAAPAVRRAADAVAKGGPRRKHPLRPALAVAAAIAALLAGTATIGSKDAAPNSALWGITQVLWPSRVESVASVRSVQNALDRATSELAAGRSREAQLILLQAAVDLGKVEDVDGRTGLQASVNELWVRAAPGLPPPTGSEYWRVSAPTSRSSVSAPPRSTARSKIQTVVPPDARTTSPLLLAGPPGVDEPSHAPDAGSSAGGPVVGGSTSTAVASPSSAASTSSAAPVPGPAISSADLTSSAGPTPITSESRSSAPDPTTSVDEPADPTSAPPTLPPPVISDPPEVSSTGDPTSIGTTAQAPAPSPPTATDPTGISTLSPEPAETTVTDAPTTDATGAPAP